MIRLYSLLASLLFSLTSTALGAEFTYVAPEFSKTHTVPLIKLSGTIESGDVKLLEAALSAAYMGQKPDGGTTQAVVSLSSEGGSFQAGQELADYFRKNAIGTIVERGNACISACAVAFLGGRGFWPTGGIGFYKLRLVEPGATVGFHAPYFPAAGVAPAMVPKLVEGTRLSIAQLIQVLETNDVDPKVMYRVVEMGPDQRLTIDTIGDLFNFRLNLPSFPESTIALREADKVRNACLKLLVLEYGQTTNWQNQFLAKSASIRKDSKGKRWNGFTFDDAPYGIRYCGQLQDQSASAGDRTIQLLGGLDDDDIEVKRSVTVAAEGWSYVSSMFSYRSILPLNYWYLPNEVKLSDLAKQPVSAAISKERWGDASALPLLKLGGGPSVDVYTSDRHRVAKIGPFIVYVHAGAASLFDKFKQEDLDRASGVSFKKLFNDAAILSGRRTKPNSVFYWFALREGARSAIVRIEHSTGPSGLQTDAERALTQEIACKTRLGAARIPCG